MPVNGIRYPFSSSRKRMTTQVLYRGENYLLIKGASEYILTSCSHIHYWDTNEIVPKDLNLEGVIKDAIHSMAKRTLRTLCLAYKKVENIPTN